ncbi:hypothetical protein ACFVTC_20515 [Streptomyces sp. NPDC057950]|uniref:hypothetical protein n=1 Tax=Streptomyces sp. NPDC057950 TaxID=3346288 RepID=UPI0036E8223D
MTAPHCTRHPAPYAASAPEQAAHGANSSEPAAAEPGRQLPAQRHTAHTQSPAQ